MNSIEEYNYDLPKELIAQEPMIPRSHCNLMILENNKIIDQKFYDIIDYLEKGDVLVFNISKVMKARIYGEKTTGGKVEILIESNSDINSKICWAMYKGKNIKENSNLIFKNNQKKEILAKVIKREENRLKLEFEKKIIDIMEGYGQMPTPPYIKKFLENQEEYQTIYAKEMGSMAAPTAGLHFDNELLEKIKKKGIKIANVILHVSYDTFLPINENDYTKHNIHGEFCEIKQIDCDIINNAYNNKNNIIIVGTTTLRTIESFSKDKKVYSGKKITKLYVYPGYKFQSPINGLITNFHLPKSSLLLLVSALYGKERMLKAYNHAITKKYRFFSFGDAMFIKI